MNITIAISTIIGLLSAGFLYQRMKRRSAEAKNILSDVRQSDAPLEAKQNEIKKKNDQLKQEIKEIDSSKSELNEMADYWNKKDKK